MASSPEAALSIDIVSDVVCPWCFIGKRRLEAALALYRQRFPARPEPQVRWWPFQLNPDLPAEGVDRVQYMAARFGQDKLDAMHDRLAGIGREVGIPFAFDKIVRQPNTLLPHSLIALAAAHGMQDEMAEALFQAYFVEGADLSSKTALAALAEGVGLPAPMVQECLVGESLRDHVAGQDAQARQMGVSGVPFFIFNSRLAVSGAHEPESLLGAMIEAQQEPATA